MALVVSGTHCEEWGALDNEASKPNVTLLSTHYSASGKASELQVSLSSRMNCVLLQAQLRDEERCCATPTQNENRLEFGTCGLGCLALCSLQSLGAQVSTPRVAIAT